MVVERHVDAEITETVIAASRAAYRRVAELVAPRITSGLVAAAGQTISEAEWVEILTDASDAYGDGFLDAVITGGVLLGVLPTDEDFIARLESQARSVDELAGHIRGLLDDFLEESQREGLTAEQIRERLLADAPSSPLASWRAEAFARTATTTAVNAGFAAAFKAAGVAAVTWISMRDDRVREAHAIADRDIVPTGTPFTIGGYEANYPGDPQLPIEYRINCRCMLGWVDGNQVKQALDATRDALYRTARQLGVRGRSKMNKAQLQIAVIEHLCLQGLAAGPDCPDVLDQMNMATLMTHARLANIRGRSRMRRQQLLDAVKGEFTRTDVPSWFQFSTAALAWDPNQPRHPAGSAVGGRWRDHGSSSDERRAMVRTSNVLRRATPAQRERYSSVYGRGIESVFDGEQSASPFDVASDDQIDRAALDRQLAQGVVFVDVDPRTLVATRPSVAKAPVEYYLTDEYAQTGRRFANQDDAENRYPIVYRNPNSRELMILSGHSRAAAALVAGRALKARYVDPKVIVLRGGDGPAWLPGQERRMEIGFAVAPPGTVTL